MKKLYRMRSTEFILELKNGNKRTLKSDNFGYIYHYGEVPEDIEEEFVDWKSLLLKLRYVPDYEGSVTRLKKRIYIEEHHCGLGRIYKDEFVKLTFLKKYEEIPVDKYPSIERLENDLGFMDYSEFVFERENQLKRMLVK